MTLGGTTSFVEAGIGAAAAMPRPPNQLPLLAVEQPLQPEESSNDTSLSQFLYPKQDFVYSGILSGDKKAPSSAGFARQEAGSDYERSAAKQCLWQRFPANPTLLEVPEPLNS